jgi:hypothetical protein
VGAQPTVETSTNEASVGRLAVSLDMEVAVRRKHRLKEAKTGIDRLWRSADPPPESKSVLLHPSEILAREPAAWPHRGSPRHEDEVASALDEDRDGHWTGQATGLKGLELVELEGAGQSAGHRLHPGAMKSASYAPQTPAQAVHGVSTAPQNPCRLSVCHLRGQEMEQLNPKGWPPHPIAQSEGLSGKSPVAAETAESGDANAVAGPAVVAFAAVAESPSGGGLAVRSGAEWGVESSVQSSSPRRRVTAIDEDVLRPPQSRCTHGARHSEAGQIHWVDEFNSTSFSSPSRRYTLTLSPSGGKRNTLSLVGGKATSS